MALGIAAGFVAMATLFAELLRPLAPSQAAVMASDDRRGPGLPAKAKPALQRALDDKTARPPIAIVPVTDVDDPQIDTARQAAGDVPGAAPATATIPEGPLVAIVLTELGPNAAAAKAAIAQLPPAISLAFSPYADASRGLASAARAGGHEVWLSVPMQPKSYPRVSPGKHVLLTAATGEENRRNLAWALSRIDGPVGITNMMGSAFTEDARAMRPVIDMLKSLRLSYVDARSSGKSVGEREAKAAGVPAATNDRFLDEPETAANIRRNLDDLVAAAKRRGHAIGYARPTPETIRQIAGWAAELETAGVTLVGAGVVARKNSDG